MFDQTFPAMLTFVFRNQISYQLSVSPISQLAVPTELRDVCGADDPVFAALAVAIITGKSLREACQMAMGAAGRQVAAVGIASVA